MKGKASAGTLIVFEGIDGTGKTTQLDRLARRLRELGLDVETSREPTAGHHGKKLRESARSGRLSLREEYDTFQADRAEHVVQTIEPALERGAVVLLDRYYFSTVAYQGARGLDPREILRDNRRFAPRPDLILLFALPIETALRRIRRRSDEANAFEAAAALARVSQIFDELDDPAIARIDAAPDPDAVAASVFEACLAHCPAVADAHRNTDTTRAES